MKSNKYLLMLLLFFAVAIPWVIDVHGEEAARDSAAKQKSASEKTVSMTVDYGDGAEKRLKKIPWKKKMTVESVMEFAAKHRHGVKFAKRGKGSTAFVEKIDDLKNEGARGKNWIYRVNNKLGDRSYAIFELKPGDTVLWKFDKYP